MVNNRTFAFGDIHGCNALLKKLITEIAPQAEDTLIFLGDMIDRGGDSKGVIDTILSYQKVCNVITILGNHEQMFQDSKSNTACFQSWLKFGGSETLDSFNQPYSIEGVRNIPLKYQDFLKNLLPYYETDNFIYTHATPFPQLSMSSQDEKGLRWRNIPDYDTKHISGKTIICGHTTQYGGDVYCNEGIIGIDTYAYGNGNLTALEIKPMIAWQVSHDLNIEKVDLSQMVEFLV